MTNMRFAAASLILHLLPVAVSGQRGGQVVGDSAVWREARLLRERVFQDARSSASDVLRLGELEITLGRPAKARELLEGMEAGVLPKGKALALLGAARYEESSFGAAAEAFAAAADLGLGAESGILAARAGDAYERAGSKALAAAQYRIAGDRLPQLAGWVAIREARVTEDPAVALDLLRRAPRSGRELALQVQAEVLLTLGDTAGAAAALAAGGDLARAAHLSFQTHDSVTARSLAYQATAARDTAIARAGLNLAKEHFAARTAAEFLLLARAARRLGLIREATRYAMQAAARDSSSADALLFLGDVLAGAGARTRALTVYRRAADLAGEAAEEAAYRRGRLLMTAGQYSRGVAELTAFAEEYPASYRAPVALYVVADRQRRLRRAERADSILEEVSRRWPRHPYASRARLRLADRAFGRGDTTAAAAWLRAEVTVGGAERNAALFRLASLAADSVDAVGLFAALARSDSLGYYGTIARSEAGLPPLRIEPAPAAPVSPVVEAALQELDLLRRVKFEAEEATLIDYLVAKDPRPPSEILDLAEGFVERGYLAQAIALGWRATRPYTLNDPRVLRVIFPWPLRDLIEEEAEQQGIDPYLLAGLIRQESAFRAAVVSRAGAYGLMQLMPATARQVARKIGVEWHPGLLTVPDANLHIGAAHLAELIDRYDGDVVPALAAYNAGATPVRRWLRYPEAADPVEFVERVPYPETRGYLRTVIRNRSLYRALYPPVEQSTVTMP